MVRYIYIYAMKLVLENCGFLVYMYYMHRGYQTSIFGKNRAYYIQILMVYFAHATQIYGT